MNSFKPLSKNLDSILEEEPSLVSASKKVLKKKYETLQDVQDREYKLKIIDEEAIVAAILEQIKANKTLTEASYNLSDDDINKLADRLKSHNDGSRKSLVFLIANGLNRMSAAGGNPTSILLLVAGLALLNVAGNDEGMISLAKRIAFTGLSQNRGKGTR